jgi:single-strand DNA-binding protein
VVWGKFGEWASSLKKGAFIEAEGELRYREFQPNGSDAKIRTDEIHAISRFRNSANRTGSVSTASRSQAEACAWSTPKTFQHRRRFALPGATDPSTAIP